MIGSTNRRLNDLVFASDLSRKMKELAEREEQINGEKS